MAIVHNPKSQNDMARTLNTSQSTVNRIIHEDLNLITRRKTKVHRLTERDKINRKINTRKLYERHLAGERSRYVVTLDEANVYINYCNGKRSIYYARSDEKQQQTLVKECKESYPEGFMVVGCMTGLGTVPLFKVSKNVKINSAYYVNHVLRPIFEIHLPRIYGEELYKVFFHHDKATSHTSRLTEQYLQQMKELHGINYIQKSDIPVKGPDASPLDFFGFGLIKQRLFKRKACTLGGFWKVLQEEWSRITPVDVSRAFGSWKRRCRLITKANGSHIENTKKIHKRCI
jgi:hypothetical protein